MNHNPYTPPMAAVADLAEAPRPMPASVRSALFVMVASLILNIVIAAISPDSSYAGSSETVRVFAIVFSLVVALVLTAWLGWKIAVGRNWARIVLLVLTCISVPMAFLEIARLVPTWPLGAGLKFVEQGMDIAVVCLLFIPGRAYFRK
jgi:hypothetical protein